MSSDGGSDGHNGQLKRRGRPPADPAQKRDQNITFRTSIDLKLKLEEAATANGRTVSQEIEYWLRFFLDREALKKDSNKEAIEIMFGEYCALQIKAANDQAKKLIEIGAEKAKERATEVIAEMTGGGLNVLIEKLAEEKAKLMMKDFGDRLSVLENNRKNISE